MSSDLRAELVRNWWSKAAESLASARLELESGSTAFAVNRVYYAAFYAVTAALLDRELSVKSHTGTRTAFHREFIRTGLLDDNWGKFYDQVFQDRQQGDYTVKASFGRKYVEMQLETCSRFLAALRPHVSSLLEEQSVDR